MALLIRSGGTARQGGFAVRPLAARPRLSGSNTVIGDQRLRGPAVNVRLKFLLVGLSQPVSTALHLLRQASCNGESA